MVPEFDSSRMQTGFHRSFGHSKDAGDFGQTETFQVIKIQNHLRAGRQPAEDVVDIGGQGQVVRGRRTWMRLTLHISSRRISFPAGGGTMVNEYLPLRSRAM